MSNDNLPADPADNGSRLPARHDPAASQALASFRGANALALDRSSTPLIGANTT